ncbi:MAG: protein kinase [Desulfatiglandaceae bacterium]
MNEITNRRFGKYMLLDKVALGGMAELYRAMITGVQGFEKLIAVKRILPHLTIEKELVDSFIDEAKLAALLHHQNIVQIYDFGSVEKSYFIAMEYLFGKDLNHVTEKAKQKGDQLDLENALHIVSRVASGLHYAHNLKDFQGKPLNIIHRDISPQNVFITYEGDVKIVDFGIAKAATRSSMTQVGMIKGKVAYMSPEQADGKVIDYRSDIFSLGIILYELVTGKRMFQGDTMQILSKVRVAEFVPPDQLVKDLPAKLYDILGQSLAMDPEKRYQSCNDMLADLEECMYALPKRPTTRGLSGYMKGLFKGEIAEEEKTMRDLVGDHSGGAPEKEKAPVPSKKVAEEHVEEPPSHRDEKPGKKGLILAAIGGIVLVVLLVVIFWPGEKPAKQSAESPKAVVAEKQAPAEQATQATGTQAPASENKPEEAAKPATGESAEKEASTSEQAPEEEKGAAKLAEAKGALDEKRYGDAVALFEVALTENPALKEKASADYEKALLAEADSVAKTDPEMMERLLLKAVDLNPASVKAHAKLGFLYVQRKDFPEAVRQYTKVSELDPEYTDAFFNLGYLYAVTKDYEQAEKAYQRVVELKPDYLDEALFNLAMVQNRLGKKAECIANLEKALELNPKNERVKNYLKKLKKQ